MLHIMSTFDLSSTEELVGILDLVWSEQPHLLRFENKNFLGSLVDKDKAQARASISLNLLHFLDAMLKNMDSQTCIRTRVDSHLAQLLDKCDIRAFQRGRGL
jgi:hypothetical protein